MVDLVAGKAALYLISFRSDAARRKDHGCEWRGIRVGEVRHVLVTVHNDPLTICAFQHFDQTIGAYGETSSVLDPRMLAYVVMQKDDVYGGQLPHLRLNQIKCKRADPPVNVFGRCFFHLRVVAVKGAAVNDDELRLKIWEIHFDEIFRPISIGEDLIVFFETRVLRRERGNEGLQRSLRIKLGDLPS